eukprot:Sspe_Gene.83729::Locus_54922_Transcript_2_3_Confidence_0.500_Length_1498::g.83729::m.83729
MHTQYPPYPPGTPYHCYRSTSRDDSDSGGSGTPHSTSMHVMRQPSRSRGGHSSRAGRGRTQSRGSGHRWHSDGETSNESASSVSPSSSNKSRGGRWRGCTVERLALIIILIWMGIWFLPFPFLIQSARQALRPMDTSLAKVGMWMRSRSHDYTRQINVKVRRGDGPWDDGQFLAVDGLHDLKSRLEEHYGRCVVSVRKRLKDSDGLVSFPEVSEEQFIELIDATHLIVTFWATLDESTKCGGRQREDSRGVRLRGSRATVSPVMISDVEKNRVTDVSTPPNTPLPHPPTTPVPPTPTPSSKGDSTEEVLKELLQKLQNKNDATDHSTTPPVADKNAQATTAPPPSPTPSSTPTPSPPSSSPATKNTTKIAKQESSAVLKEGQAVVAIRDVKVGSVVIAQKGSPGRIVHAVGNKWKVRFVGEFGTSRPVVAYVGAHDIQLQS